MVKNYFSKFGEIEDTRVIRDNKKKNKPRIYGFVLFTQKQSLEKVTEIGLYHDLGGSIIAQCKPTLLREELKEIQKKAVDAATQMTPEERKQRKKDKKRLRRMKRKLEKLKEQGKDYSDLEQAIISEEARLKAPKNQAETEPNEEINDNGENQENHSSCDLFKKTRTPSESSKEFSNQHLIKNFGKKFLGHMKPNEKVMNHPKFKNKNNFLNLFFVGGAIAKAIEMDEEMKNERRNEKRENEGEILSVQKTAEENEDEAGHTAPLAGFGLHRKLVSHTQSENAGHGVFDSGHSELSEHKGKIVKGKNYKGNSEYSKNRSLGIGLTGGNFNLFKSISEYAKEKAPKVEEKGLERKKVFESKIFEFEEDANVKISEVEGLSEILDDEEEEKIEKMNFYQIDEEIDEDELDDEIDNLDIGENVENAQVKRHDIFGLLSGI
jgi:hypothetical protein